MLVHQWVDLHFLLLLGGCAGPAAIEAVWRVHPSAPYLSVSMRMCASVRER